MKNQIFILSILLLMFSCNSKTGTRGKVSKVDLPEEKIVELKTEIITKPIEKVKQKNKEVRVENKELAKLIIDDESQYSKNFIDKLRAVNGMKEIEFREGKMILNQKDSIDFPDIPDINRKLKFAGVKEELAIALSINRINYTSIEYTLEMTEFGKSSNTINGVADLGGFFFLASESDTDELRNVSYLSTAFSDTKDSCYTDIRIGNVEDSNDKPLLAKIEKNCNGGIMNIDLNNFPTLREK